MKLGSPRLVIVRCDCGVAWQMREGKPPARMCVEDGEAGRLCCGGVAVILVVVVCTSSSLHILCFSMCYVSVCELKWIDGRCLRG